MRKTARLFSGVLIPDCQREIASGCTPNSSAIAHLAQPLARSWANSSCISLIVALYHHWPSMNLSKIAYYVFITKATSRIIDHIVNTGRSTK